MMDEGQVGSGSGQPSTLASERTSQISQPSFSLGNGTRPQKASEPTGNAPLPPSDTTIAHTDAPGPSTGQSNPESTTTIPPQSQSHPPPTSTPLPADSRRLHSGQIDAAAGSLPIQTPPSHTQPTPTQDALHDSTQQTPGSQPAKKGQTKYWHWVQEGMNAPEVPLTTLPGQSTPTGTSGRKRKSKASTPNAVAYPSVLATTSATPIDTPVQASPSVAMTTDNVPGSSASGANATPGVRKGITLQFRRPESNGNPGETNLTPAPTDQAASSAASSPSGSTSSKRKRRGISLNPTRASRQRIASPQTKAADPSSALTSQRPTPVPTSAPAASNSLSIFAPPHDATLPEALQSVIGPPTAAVNPDSSMSTPASSRRSEPANEAGPSTGTVTPQTATTRGGGRFGGQNGNSARKDRDGDTIMREAGEGLESRLRARAKKDIHVKTGVSASGKGVTVGSAVKESGKAVKKKDKDKAKPSDAEIPNQDFCSACRGIGKFLCCDGCPRSFHFMCLEPPLRIDELPEEETWYCKKCTAERNPAPRIPDAKGDGEREPVQTLFKKLAKRVDGDNPSAFRLPTEVRSFFTGTSSDAKGNYLDSEETRTKYDRKGFQEDRDGTRLRDGKSRPVSCYVCGGTSIPIRSLTTDPGSTWRQIVSCDYCALHWHLDCLNPPMPNMPPSNRKWMCPNHAEQVMARRRTVRNGLETVDVNAPSQRNNGNIVIVPDEDREQLEYEDMIINKRRYRVPEKIIKLDFWEKLGYGTGRAGLSGRRYIETSGASQIAGPSNGRREDEPPSQEDIDAANLVLSVARALPQPSLGLANNVGLPSVADPSKVTSNGNKTGNISDGDDDDGVSDGDPPDLSARTEGVDLPEPPEESVLTEDERSLSEAEGDDGSRSSPGLNGKREAGVEPEVDRISIPASRVSNGSKGSKSSTPRIVLRVPKKG